MDSDAFIHAIKSRVRDAAISGTLDNLARPKGRRPRADLVEMAAWFAELAPEHRSMLARVLKEVADEAVFGLLAVLDGARPIEGESGTFELFYCHANERILLNDPQSDSLHDIFNSVS